MKGKVFTTQEVQSMIAGNKTQFREVIKPQPRKDVLEYTADRVDLLDKCPYQVGQKIFCKEKWLPDPSCDEDAWDEHELSYRQWSDDFGHQVSKMPESLKKLENAYYQAGTNNSIKWMSAQSMPQWASRLTMLIKEIRVEKLADISEEDAIAEGIEYDGGWEEECGDGYGEGGGFLDYSKPEDESFSLQAVSSFKTLWNATHKKPEEKFEASPWVWVIQFEVVK